MHWNARLVAVTSLLATAFLVAPVSADHDPDHVYDTAGATTTCPGTSAVLDCEARAFIAVEALASDCRNGGCSAVVTCGGTAVGTVLVAGELFCGDPALATPSVGAAACTSPGIALGETSCSVASFGSDFVENGNCADFVAEVSAEGPAGAAVAAAILKFCVTSSGQPHIP